MLTVRFTEPATVLTVWSLIHEDKPAAFDFCAQATRFEMLIVRHPSSGYYVGVVGYGCYSFALGRHNSGYVESKLGLPTSADADNITHLLTALGSESPADLTLYLNNLDLDGDHPRHV